jgi:hypothetical protein
MVVVLFLSSPVQRPTFCGSGLYAWGNTGKAYKRLPSFIYSSAVPIFLILFYAFTFDMAGAEVVRDFVPLPWLVTYKYIFLDRELMILVTHRSLKEIRDQIPARLFRKDTRRSLLYFGRDLILAATIFAIMYNVNNQLLKVEATSYYEQVAISAARWTAWAA